MHRKLRKDAGVVDRDGLENRCTLTGTQGSNPCLSANSKNKSVVTHTVTADLVLSHTKFHTNYRRNLNTYKVDGIIYNQDESWFLREKKRIMSILTTFPICLKVERYEKRAGLTALSNRLLSVSKIVAFALEVFR